MHISSIFKTLALLLWLMNSALAKNILVFGDSLSAGYGIRLEDAWPQLLDRRLASQSENDATLRQYKVINASISGETTAGGRARLAALLSRHQPAVVIIELGANDGLRGLPVNVMKDNLAAMQAMVARSGAKTLLVGMRLPPNYGPYADDFARAFAELARQSKTPLLPFLMEKIAAQPQYFQPDGLHPTKEAQALLVDTVWPALRPLLR